jgi:hypothetical protein
MVRIDVHIQIGICSYAMFAMYLAWMSWAAGSTAERRFIWVSASTIFG